MNADLDCTAGSQYAARLLRNAAAAGSVEGPPRCARCPPCVRRRFSRTELVFAPFRASEDAFHARSWFSRLPGRMMGFVKNIFLRWGILCGLPLLPVPADGPGNLEDPPSKTLFSMNSVCLWRTGSYSPGKC